MIARCRLVSGSFCMESRGETSPCLKANGKAEKCQGIGSSGLGLVIILIAVISLYQLGKQAYDLYLVRKETVKSSEKIKAIEKDNERLEEERSNLHDPKYVEKVARMNITWWGKMKFRSSSWMKRKNRGARLRMGAFFFAS